MKKKLTRFMSLICVALFLTGALFLAGCSGDGEQASESTAGKSAEEIATTAFTNLEAAKNYDIDMNMLMSMEMMGQKMDLTMNGNGTYFNDPLKMQMKMKMKMETGMDLGEPMEEESIDTYFIQEGNSYVMYINSAGIWIKSTLPEDQLSSQMMQMSPTDSMDLYMKNLKEAVNEGEEKIGDVNTDKIKLVASGDIFQELMENMDMSEALGLDGSMDGLSDDFLKDLGDLTYYVWVNKADSSLVKVQMDLGPIMRSLGATMTGENAPPEFADMSDMEKALLKQTFENITFTLDYSIKNIDKAADFTLPEAAASAIETPLS